MPVRSCRSSGRRKTAAALFGSASGSANGSEDAGCESSMESLESASTYHLKATLSPHRQTAAALQLHKISR